MTKDEQIAQIIQALNYAVGDIQHSIESMQLNGIMTILFLGI